MLTKGLCISSSVAFYITSGQDHDLLTISQVTNLVIWGVF